jgi:hypothetical protein
MAAQTFVSGKTGRVSWGNTNLFMKDWRLSVEADMIPADAFEKTASNGEYFRSYLTGLIGGTANISGLFDTTASQMPSGTALAIRAGKSIAASGGQVTSVFLGITTTIGYTILGKVKSIEPSNSVDGAAEFSFTIQIEDVQYTSQT